ncbi:CvpA family protein [Aridibaculum aurantiacum]|uniref:CvpA family protein n=1 Tax=Aridibaculum aurantiacum TaxID=2810307 RepID=UPI001A968664|nr:CvpA family protein [Aridibaculum aurantiacum]
MIIDIIFLFLVVFAIFKGFSRGLIVAVFSFFALMIGLAAALKLSATVAASLQADAGITGKWLPILSFFLVFIGVMFLVRIGARMVKKAVSIVMLGWADTLGGIILYGMIYLLIYSVILFYAANIGLISEETQQASSTFSIIAPFGPAVVDGIGLVLPFFRDMFAQLSEFFENVNAKGSGK